MNQRCRALWGCLLSCVVGACAATVDPSTQDAGSSQDRPAPSDLIISTDHTTSDRAMGPFDDLAMRRSSRSWGSPRAPGGLKRTACSGSGRFSLRPHPQARPCCSTVPFSPLRRKPRGVVRVPIARSAVSRGRSTHAAVPTPLAARADKTRASGTSRSPRCARGSTPTPKPSRTQTAIPPPTPSSAALSAATYFTASGSPCSSASPSAARAARDWPRASSSLLASRGGSARRPRAASAPHAR